MPVPLRSRGRAARVPILIAAAAILLASGCASRRAASRSFAVAGEELRARALAAWRQAAERADALGSSRLLYAARVRQGIASISGTLAVETSSPLRAVLTGPFGTPLATYTDGALRGEKFAPVFIEPEPLLWLLAGVWKAPSPEVRGVDGDDALLVWTSPSPSPEGAEVVTGVLNVPRARFNRLRVERNGRAIEAVYSGDGDPLPDRIELTDVATGSTLRLILEGREPIDSSRGSAP